MRETILTSSVLILILIALRYSLRRRISLRLQYALWGFAALRLIMPFSFFSSPISIMNIVADNSMINEASNYFLDGLHNPQVTAEPFLDGLTNAVTSAIQPDNQNFAALLSMPHAMSLQETLMIIWLAGAIMVAAWLIITNLKLKQRLRTAELCREINCVLPVYRADWLPSSCLFGLLHPAIYLNASAYKNKYSLHHVLTHELCHHAHRDQLWSLVRGLCLVLHWYNPLVWVAAALSKRDCELACDEAAIEKLGEAERVPYGMTILTLIQQSTVFSPLASIATTMASGKRSLKERVTLISKKPKLMMIVTIGLVLVMAIAVGCTFSGAKVDEGITEIGDIKEAFLTVYGTYNYESRYDIWLKNIVDVGADKTGGKLRVMQEEYYACIRDYVSEEFYLPMMANREIITYEKYAYENGFSYRTDGFEFEEYSKNADSTTYNFVVHMILTYTDGIEKRGTVKGQISVSDKDGLISNFYLSPTGFQPVANIMSPATTETPTPGNTASLNLQSEIDRTDPRKTAAEFLDRYFESANNGGLLLLEFKSGLFEPTQSIVTAMKYLDWITLINFFSDYDIARDMGHYSSMQDVNITNEGDITIVKGYLRTTAFGTFFEIQMQKNKAGNYVITGLDFPDSKEYINFVEAFKMATGELDAQKSPYIDEQYKRILKECISDKKMTDEQIAVAVAKWHAKIHATWNIAYDIDNPAISYLTDGSGLVIFNLSRSYTTTTDSSMWLVAFNTEARPAYPTYCIDAKTFECLGYIPGA